MVFKHIEVSPISGALGAEVSGINLSQPLSDDAFEEIHQAFLENLVVFIRGQDITPEQQKTFARRFGELDIHEFVQGMEEHPEIIPIIKEAKNDGYNFGGRWHADVTYQEKPTLGSVLYGVEIPPHGGDTLWANQYMAYDRLSDGMKRMLDGMKSVHSAAMVYGPNGRAAQAKETANGGYTASMTINPDEKANEERLHPVVCTHPDTGRKYLFVNYGYTERFEDMTVEESKPLLDYLFEHCTREEFSCRFRWETGSIAVWDNRCTQHYALNDYHGHRREMHRATITGTVPV